MMGGVSETLWSTPSKFCGGYHTVTFTRIGGRWYFSIDGIEYVSDEEGYSGPVRIHLWGLSAACAGFPAFFWFDQVHALPIGADEDGDGIHDDGDESGLMGDARCRSGTRVDCDDNCPMTPNADQADSDGDGIGNVCE
jgi:hypothetical protein